MDLNDVIGLANQAMGNGNDFAFMRWNKYMDNNKEFKRPDLWTFKMISPAKAIYYPGDQIINARLSTINVNRNSWNLPIGDAPMIRGYKPIGGQPNGFIDMSGEVTLNFVDKVDYAIELWIKSIRDLVSHPETRFSYPIELLMSTMEAAFHTSQQERCKVWTMYNCVPKSVAVGDEDFAENPTWAANNTIAFAFPYHKEDYLTRY